VGGAAAGESACSGAVRELAAEKAQLAAELKVRDAALRSIILSKVAVIPLNDAVLQATDRLLLDAATAQFRLGLMFDNGQGVAQDFAEAVRLYSLAAAQGHADLGYSRYHGPNKVNREVHRTLEIVRNHAGDSAFEKEEDNQVSLLFCRLG
jgi:TPR repeat protein